MKKTAYFVLSVIFISIFQNLFLSHLLIKTDLVGNVVTFLSIIFGFYITSLSIFVTSRYVSSLYKVSDKNDKNVTLLHTLFNNYKFGLIFTLVSIIYFLIIHLILDQSEISHIYLSHPVLLLFFGVLINNFWYSFAMLQDLIKVVLQEAKNIKSINN